jgi:RNA polymerase sigma factor (sigma-70 family)
VANAADREDRFRRVCEAHTAAVLAYALRRTSRDDAADVVAETFLVAWRRLDDVDEQNALPWLYAVARRVLLSQHRATRRQQAIAERAAATAEPASSDAPQPASFGSQPLREALAGLPETEREVLMLSAWEELSGPEAARVLGCSATAYRIRLHRARKRLRERLAEIDPDLRDRLPPAARTARTEESPSC